MLKIAIGQSLNWLNDAANKQEYRDKQQDERMKGETRDGISVTHGGNGECCSTRPDFQHDIDADND